MELVASEIRTKKNRSSRDPLAEVEVIRRTLNGQIDPKNRAKYAQFMTPAPIAAFMASHFNVRQHRIRLLDPGAGIGSLTAAFVAALLKKRSRVTKIHVTAFEIDRYLADHLHQTLDLCAEICRESGILMESNVRQEDFISACARQDTGRLFDAPREEYDCIILNPPYGKLNSASETRRLLRCVGVETSNYYSAFLALSARHLSPGGELVSITPRSFCNGPYFEPFRKYFHTLMSIKGIHVFESRDSAFKDDDVLQENVVVHAVKSKRRPARIVLSSSAAPGAPVVRKSTKYQNVIDSRDPHLMINLCLDANSEEAAKLVGGLGHRLQELNIEVSTGRVVHFRATKHLSQDPKKGSVPLIYPRNFSRGRVVWPVKATGKPVAIEREKRTQALLVPAGKYVLVKRFSAKEERRRIVAAYYNLSRGRAEYVGFENHVNYYHSSGSGLKGHVAIGLCVYLNSSVVDSYFRIFSGHTQVNATDLRVLPYPSVDRLEEIGKRMSGRNLCEQREVDKTVEDVLRGSVGDKRSNRH